jgi:hypothetical protein
MTTGLGRLDPRPEHRSDLGSLIVDATDEVGRIADRLHLLVKDQGGKRLGADNLIEELQLVLQALGSRYFSGPRDGLLRNEYDLANTADIAPSHARILVDQHWPMLNRLLLTYLVRERILPEPSAQRLVVATDSVTGRPEASWDDGGAQVLTPVVQTAVIPGVAEIIIDGVAWEVHPSSATRKRRLPRRVGRAARHPLRAPADVGRALMQETVAFHQMLEQSSLRDCKALGRSIPVVADVWRYGRPNREIGQLADDRVAPGDAQGMLQAATEHQLPALMVSMVGTEGAHRGSLDTSDVYFHDGWFMKFSGPGLLDRLLALRPPFDEIFEDILLFDDERRAAAAGIPKGVRYINAPGHLIVGGTPQCTLVRMTVSGEPTIFAHNIEATEKGKTRMVIAAEALVSLRHDQATSACLSRSFSELGAPFTVKGTSTGARFGMLGLGAFFNQLLIAAVRRREI